MALFQFGNSKLAKSTIVFNMGSAVYCPSKKLGLCKLGNKCYALKFEKMYPSVLPCHNKQNEYWLNNTAIDIYKDMLKAIGKKDIKYFRYNVSGDFHSQNCVDKLNKLSKLLKKHNIISYGYTARSDLNYKNVSFIVHGSGFKNIHGETRVLYKDTKKLKSFKVCPSVGCGTKCVLCMSKSNVYFKLH